MNTGDTKSAQQAQNEQLGKTLRGQLDLLSNLAQLHDRGAVIVLPNGDELALTPEAIDAHLSNQAERAGLAADEAYYGGDSPGSYGPDDPGPGGNR